MLYVCLIELQGEIEVESDRVGRRFVSGGREGKGSKRVGSNSDFASLSGTNIWHKSTKLNAPHQHVTSPSSS
jgi:hypothetical protein